MPAALPVLTEQEQRLEVVREGFATIKEAAAYLRLGRSKVYLMLDQGKLPYSRFDRCRRIPWQSLRAYAAASLQGLK
jgi:excisionase family DNA binding protein